MYNSTKKTAMRVSIQKRGNVTIEVMNGKTQYFIDGKRIPGFLVPRFQQLLRDKGC